MAGAQSYAIAWLRVWDPNSNRRITDGAGDEEKLALPAPLVANAHPLYESSGFKVRGRNGAGAVQPNSRGHLFPSAMAFNPAIGPWAVAVAPAAIAVGGAGGGGIALSVERVLSGATFTYANIVPSYQPFDGTIWGMLERSVTGLVDHCWSNVAANHMRWHYAAGRGLKRYGYLQAAAVHGAGALNDVADSFTAVADADLVTFPNTLWGIVAGELRLSGVNPALSDRTVALAWVCKLLPALSADVAPQAPCTFMSVATLVSDHLQGWDPMPGLTGNINPWAGMLSRTTARKNANAALLFPQPQDQVGGGAVAIHAAAQCNPAGAAHYFTIAAVGGAAPPAVAWQVNV